MILLKKMSPRNYDNTQIYKLIVDGEEEVVYGFTTQPLNARLTQLKRKFKFWKSGLCAFKPEFAIFDLYGAANVKIELVEEYPVSCLEEAENRLEYYLDNFDNVNDIDSDDFDDFEQYLEQQNDVLGFQNDDYDGDVEKLIEKIYDKDIHVSFMALRRLHYGMY